MVNILRFIRWRGDLRDTLVLSLLIHLILFLLFLYIHISNRIDLPEFVEVRFVRTGQTAPTRAIVRQPAPQIARESETKESPSIEESAKDKITLPKRRMLEEEPPDLSIRQSDKRIITGGKGSVSAEKEQPERRPEFVPETLPTERPELQPKPGSEEKLIPDLSRGSRPGLNQSFEIEGKAAERRILSRVLPTYPEGYNREGVIKIRFTILPNGRVGDMIPLLKTDAVLEESAMKALAKWRFNPVPAEAPQEPVEGIITFRFRLK